MFESDISLNDFESDQTLSWSQISKKNILWMMHKNIASQKITQTSLFEMKNPSNLTRRSILLCLFTTISIWNFKEIFQCSRYQSNSRIFCNLSMIRKISNKIWLKETRIKIHITKIIKNLIKSDFFTVNINFIISKMQNNSIKFLISTTFRVSINENRSIFIVLFIKSN